jgi:hypothetical protein
MNHLARLRFDQAQLASHPVDPARLGELRFREVQLAILLAKLLAQ